MTYDETLIIMGTLRVAYPQYYRNMTQKDAESAAALWAEMFSCDDLPMVIAAVKAFIAVDTKGFPPHIGAIKEQIAKIKEYSSDDELTEAEAWKMVSDASKGYYGARDFDDFPKDIKRIVGSRNMLHTWGMLPEDEVETVVASNFMRSYRAIKAYNREHQKLPEATLNFIQLLSDRMAMPEMLSTTELLS